jgi:hypothetical protein
MTEQFWFKDPAVLFRSDTWTRFVPIQSMTTTEALNSVVRFTVYSAVLLFVSTQKQSYLYAIPIVAIASIVLHQLFPKGKTLETFMDSFAKPSSKKYTMPTPDNPFMNVNLTDIQDNPDRQDAAPISDKEVRSAVHKAFKQTRNIQMDTSDLFDQTQAMRTFHTLQSARVPNDQDGFLSFLAKGYDEEDTSSAAPSRGGKLLSEGYVHARGAMRDLPSSTSKPEGTVPLGDGSPATAKQATL